MKINFSDGCDSCGLCHIATEKFVSSTGSSSPDVIIVCEEESLLMEQVLSQLGLKPRYVKPIKCQTTEQISKKHLQACSHYIHEEIAHYNVKHVAVLGNASLYATLRESSVSNWHGSILEENGITYIISYSPKYIKHNQTKQDEWLNIFITLSELVAGTYEEDVEDVEYIYPKTYEQLEEMRQMLATSDKVSYDLETSSLDPWYIHQDGTDAKILVMSFATVGLKKNYAYSYPLDHKDAWWPDLDLAHAITKRILEELQGRLIGHNIKFDNMWIRKNYQLDVTSYGDSMLLSHMLDSQQGIHGLKRLAGIYLGMYNYDQPLEEYKHAHPAANPAKTYNGEPGNYGNIPLKLLLPYACMDTDATGKIHEILYEKLTDHQRRLYHGLIMEASDALTILQANGNAIDPYIVERYYMIYNFLQQEILDNLHETPEVQACLQKLQEDYDDSLISKLQSELNPGRSRTYYQNDRQNVTIQPERIIYDNGKIVRRRKRKIATDLNPNSHLQLQKLYYDVLGAPILTYTDTGNPSIAEGATKELETDYPVIKQVNTYRSMTKALSTYIVPAYERAWVSGDGRVRSNYNLHGTRTGRLSSSDPNLQNIPTADSRPDSLMAYLPIKNIFTQSWGYDAQRRPQGFLVACDYSGMELRTFASLARCEPMLAIHRSGLDFHSMVALLARDKIPLDDITHEMVDNFRKHEKSVRYRYKWTNWTLLFGGDAFTLHRLYDMDLKDAEETVAAYYDAFPEVLEYKQFTEKFGQEHGYIESPYGRREILHYINDSNPANRSKRNADVRAAVNMPVQSSASDTLMLALIITTKRLKERGMRSMLVNTVHDEIVADVPAEELDEYVELIQDTMVNVKTYVPEYLPEIDMSWLLSPLEAEAEIGTHHGVKISYEKFKEVGYV